MFAYLEKVAMWQWYVSCIMFVRSPSVMSSCDLIGVESAVSEGT